MDKSSDGSPIPQTSDEIIEEVVAEPKPKHSSWYRSWRMLNKDQRGALITAMFLAVFLPITAMAVRNEQLTRGRAADPVTPPIEPPVAHLGEGENQDFYLTTEVDGNSNGTAVTTFHASGPLIDLFTSLTVDFKYYTVVGGSPYLQTQTFTLSKNGNEFTNQVTLQNNRGCMDFRNGNTYVISACLKTNFVGLNDNGYVFGAETWLPFVYITGQGYVWGQENGLMRVYYALNPFTPGQQHAVQSLTAGFDKNTHPYYQANNPQVNFKPTNFYWTVDPNLNPSHLVSLDYWMRPNQWVACNDDQARLGVFGSISPDPSELFYNANIWGNFSDCWFRAIESVSGAPFFGDKFLTLLPLALDPSPTPNPDPEIACSESGGVWKLFNNICADNCSNPTTCQSARVYSCDCGNLACWSGSTCVSAPPPSPVPSPSIPPRPSPSPKPSSSPRP